MWADGINFNMYSFTDFDSASVIEHSYAASGYSVVSAACRVQGDRIMGAGIVSSGTSRFLIIFYSDDGGSSWNDHRLVASTDDFWVMDVWFQETKYYVIEQKQFTIDSKFRLYVREYGTAGQDIANSPDTIYPLFYGGYFNDATDKYRFLMDEGSNVFKEYEYDSVLPHFTEIRTINDFLTPVNYNANNQVYFVNSNYRICMMLDYLYWYDFINESWSYYTANNVSVIGIIWDKDHLGNDILKFPIWGNAIWEITDKGILKKIQALEPRDYKKVYLTNTNESLAGVVQFQDANGNDDLRAWIDTSGADCTVSIVDEVDGHKNVMKMDDQSVVAKCIMTLPISTPPADGFYETWVRNDDATREFDIILYDGSNSHSIWISIIADKFKYYTTANTFVEITDAVDAIFYHIKVIFDVAATWTVIINGVSYGPYPFRGTPSNFDNFYLATNTSNIHICYIDAIGFSWDGYVSGSNKKINAYVGYGSDIGEAWFSTGDAETSIMQLSFLDYTKGTKKSLVVSEMYQAPKHTLIRRTKPFEDEWVKEYTNAEVLFYEGKVKDNDNDGRFFYKYLMNSWEDEYKTTKITVSLLAYTHGAMLKYILDNHSKYLWHGPGTNANVNKFTADQIDGTDDWTNTDGTGCLSSYVAKKAFLNGFLYHVLQQYDNGAGGCSVMLSNQSFTITSVNLVTSDVVNQFTNLQFKEGATDIGALLIFGSNLVWYNGASQTLQAAVNDTIYHIVFVFNASDDDVDIYINGVFNSTQNLWNNITTTVSIIKFITPAVINGEYVYYANLYLGNSLVDAMHTYSSISPLLTDTHDFNLKSQTHPAIQKLIAEETGYIVSVRPSGQVYLDQYAPSGVLINKDAPQGITYLSLMKIRNEKFSQITFYGGYVGGNPIIAEGFGEPNFGSYEDWFPTIDGSEVGDLYYDADGNPKSLRLDAMVAKALSDRNIVIKKQTLGKRGVGPIYHGTSLTYNNNHYKITMETWNTWRKVTYNALRDDNRVEIADSYLSPTTADPEDDRDSQVDAAIGSNADNIVKVEQNVGAVEEKTTWSPRDYGLPDFDNDGAEGTALTDDVAWNDLDISAIVGAKTMRVIIHVLGLDNVINSAVFIRTKGHTGAGCRCVIRTGSAGQEATNEWEGHTNSVGVLQIQCVPKPTSWNQISLWIADYRRA